MYTPVNPSFTIYMWGVRVCSLHGLVFVMCSGSILISVVCQCIFPLLRELAYLSVIRNWGCLLPSFAGGAEMFNLKAVMDVQPLKQNRTERAFINFNSILYFTQLHYNNGNMRQCNTNKHEYKHIKVQGQ